MLFDISLSLLTDSSNAITSKYSMVQLLAETTIGIKKETICQGHKVGYITEQYGLIDNLKVIVAHIDYRLLDRNALKTWHFVLCWFYTNDMDI